MAIGTFGAFTQARLGIYAATTGLNVTGNNISNINTEGYTRQRLNQVSLYTAGADRYYAEGDIRVGQGPLVKSLSQIRSPYLDIRYRTENARVGYYDATLDGLDQVAQILDEVGKGDASKDEDGFGVLALQINELSSALGNLTIETGHNEYDTAVREIAHKITDLLNTYANKLQELRENTATQLNQNIDTVNEHLTTIRSLNEEIRKCEIHGDAALELRDKRNVEIDNLSRLIDINVTYGEEEIAGGVIVEKLTITLDNANPDKSVKTDESLLVDGIFAAQLSIDQVPVVRDVDPEDTTSFPYWNDTTKKPVATAREATQDLVENEEWDGNDQNERYLDKYGKPTNEANAATKPQENAGYLPYLTEKGDPTDDPSKAIMGDDPLYGITISELKNRNGDLYVGSKAYAATAVTPGEAATDKDGTPTTVGKLPFTSRMNRVSVTEEDQPSPGDKTITVYTRMLRDGATKPYDENSYTYTKQVYEMILTRPVHLDDNDLGGEVQANRELLTEKGEFIEQDVINDIDEKAGEKRGIGYYENSLDLLARRLAEVLNEANQGFLRDPDGNYVTEGTNPQTGEKIGVPVTITDSTGNPYKLNVNDTWDKLDSAVQIELQNETGITYKPDAQKGTDNFKEIVDAYLKGQKYDANGEPTISEEDLKPRGISVGGVLFSNSADSDDPTGINASNISVSATWDKTALIVRGFECIPGTTEVASGQSENMLHLQYLVRYDKHDFIPNTLDGCEYSSEKPLITGTFSEMWNNIGDVLGQDRNYDGTMLDACYQTALSIDVSRDSVSAVDFNDEAMNLMMYAKSYNAACRLMTTIDSVLDKLINNTGMTT